MKRMASRSHSPSPSTYPKASAAIIHKPHLVSPLPLARRFLRSTVAVVLVPEILGAVRRIAASARNAAKDDVDEKMRAINEGWKKSALRLAKYGSLIAAVGVSERAGLGALGSSLACGAVNYMSGAMSWNWSLYLLLRSVSRVARQKGRAGHMHPAVIYALHCLHNHFVTSKADWVNPSYLRMWLGVYVGYPDLDTFLNLHSSKAVSSSENYDESISNLHALKQSMPVAWTMFKRQLGLLILLFSIQKGLISPRKRKSASKLLGDIAWLSLRSAAVLTSLPIALFKFPAFHTWITGSSRRAHPLLEALVVSVPSTMAFLFEPPSRLETITVYTYWRVIEAIVKSPWVAGKESNQLSGFASLLIAGVCQLA